MISDEVVQKLRFEQGHDSPLEKLELLKKIAGGNLTQFDFINYFKSAFPQIPLRTLTEISVSKRLIGPDGMSDAEFIQHLTPWMPLTVDAPGSD